MENQLSSGVKAWVTRQRKAVVETSTKRKECPKCHKVRDVKFFGVRTFKNKEGYPNRFALQSYCVDCRSNKAANKKSLEARRRVGHKVRQAVTRIEQEFEF